MSQFIRVCRRFTSVRNVEHSYSSLCSSHFADLDTFAMLSLTNSLGLSYRHTQMVHLSERPHTCSTCGKAFKQKAHMEKVLYSRVLLHFHGSSRCLWLGIQGTNPAFEIQLISHWFTCPQHLTSVHEKLRPCVCSLCGAAFRENYNLRSHQRYVADNF